MYTVCCIQVKMCISTHFSPSAAVPVHLWIIKAAVSRAQRRSYSVSHLDESVVSTPKVSTKADLLQKHHLHFNRFDHLFLRMAGVCGLILNAKDLKESAENIVSRWYSVRSPSQHGDQRRLKTSSTFSGRWVYPTVLQDLLPVLRHNTSAAVTSPGIQTNLREVVKWSRMWHTVLFYGRPFKKFNDMHSLNSYKNHQKILLVPVIAFLQSLTMLKLKQIHPL